ncbi:MAG: UDP-N-acetylmuramate dehydrogenase [Epsilonproteobacteria bacterium]|nr:UDP-N-acetylmuramate dehydrogenase [Campylobacterota bacterium]
MTKQIDFSKFSSIKIGPVVEVKLIDELIDQPEGSFLIGGANNILVSHKPPPLVMLSKVFEYIDLQEDLLTIGGAAKSGRIFSFCKKHNIRGFEYLSKLPGTLGGLIKMNAGMKEDEIFNALVKIKTVDGYISKEEIAYGYRFTDINTIVYEAVFKVSFGFDQEKLASFASMRQNQPSLPSAGSAFKNPKGDYAGRLIEAVGLKGYRKGEVSFSDIHANFLVNHGGASFEDATFLINLAKEKVLEKFQISLENEVIII